MSRDDYDIPDLPSDEELGIAGLEEELKAEEEARARKDAGGGGGKKAPPGTGDAPPPRGPGKPAAAAPAPSWRGPVTLLVLVLLVVLTLPRRLGPSPAAATAPDTVFSSARAMVDLVDIARRPHPPGSPDHARVRELLLERLRELGVEPEVQTAEVMVRRGGELYNTTVRNVLARIPGSAPTGALLLTAHYDGRGISRAAGDDGVGVVSILESVRALLAGAPPANDVIVLLTDAEELGLLGARAFVDQHPWMADVRAVISVEMRGGGGPSIMFETGADNGWIVQALDASGARPFANSMSVGIYRRLPNDTDFTPFREAGVQGLNFAGIGRAHVYHQAYDTPERLDERTLQHQGESVLAVSRYLAGADLQSVDAPDRSFFDLPFVGLVTYPAVWTIPITAWVLLVFVLVALVVRRTGGTAGGLIAGLLVGVVAMAGAAGAGWGLFRWVAGFHPEYRSLHGSAFHSEGYYVLALASVGLALTSVLVALARRRVGLAPLALGALIVPLLLTLGITFTAPGGAPNLQWPLLASLVGVLFVVRAGPGRRPGTLAWIGSLLVAGAVFTLWVPLLELVWLSLNLGAAAYLAGLMGVLFMLVLPALDVLNEPNRWWVPTAALVAAAAFVGLGLLQARPSADRPAPSTLIYTLDGGTGQARWVTDEGPGLDWVRTQVGPVAEERSVAEFRLGDAPRLVGEAPAVHVVPPEVAVGRMPGTAPGELRVSVASLIGAESFTIELPQGVTVETVEGRPVPEGAGPVTAVTQHGTPVDGLDLTVRTSVPLDTLEVVVIEQHLRPADLVDAEAFRRPPDLAPNIRAGSDRAVVRTQLAVTVLAADSSAIAADSVGLGEAAESPAPADTLGAPAPPPADTGRAAGAARPATSARGPASEPGGQSSRPLGQRPRR